MSTAVEELEEPEVADDATEQPEPAAEAPPTIPPEPPADCPAHIRAHYDQIREKERDVYGLEGEYLAAKERAAEAKKDFEAADKALRRLISRGADPQRELPFDKPAEQRQPKRIKIIKAFEDGEVKVAVGDEYDAINDIEPGEVYVMLAAEQPYCVRPSQFEVIEWTDPAPPAAENDSWRTAPFAELGLTAKQNDLFAAAGIDTIGDLEDLRARIAENKPDAQWPKGIGPAKVTDIENRVIDWLDKNRDKFGEPIQAAEAATSVEVGEEIKGDFEVIPEPEAEPDVTVPVHKAKANGKAKSNGKAKAKKKAKSKRRW